MIPLLPERHRPLNDQPSSAGPILYWMDRDRRLNDNWALLHAQARAIERKAALHILYVLPPTFLGSTWRQHHFMIEGLKEVAQRAKALGIRFEACVGDPSKAVLEYAKRHRVGTVVTDFSPLRLPRTWRNTLSQTLPMRLEEVDAHNVIPCWIASPKKEFAAHTFRPKAHRLLPRFLTPFPTLKKHPFPTLNTPLDWDHLVTQLKVDRTVAPVTWIKPGEKAAIQAMNHFLDNTIERYATERNDPNANATSDLSPHLHFGHLSAQRLALETEIRAPHHSDVFLEELIVRRELADNFCFYTPNYDRFAGFEPWAQTTLNAHRDDPRPFLYDRNTFEQAKTHDSLWNAAQNELLIRGKMHGYLRMFWAKKILEWTVSPEEALTIAIDLNDKYELDGRDPNGYTGIAWSIGGIHDRAWGERDIFGKIRFMNDKGCRRKFDVNTYIERWSDPA